MSAIYGLIHTCEYFVSGVIATPHDKQSGSKSPTIPSTFPQLGQQKRMNPIYRRVESKSTRRQLCRTGASGCWTTDEQKRFTSCLIRVIQRHSLFISAFTLDLCDLVAEFPEAENDEYGASALGQIILLDYSMDHISKTVLSHPKYLQDRIALIHERGSFDAVLADAFKNMLDQKGFQHWERFTTIESDGWETCARLQPADLIAFENYKLVERDSVGAKPRKSMELILDLDSVGGRGAKLTRDAFKITRSGHSPDSLIATS